MADDPLSGQPLISGRTAPGSTATPEDACLQSGLDDDTACWQSGAAYEHRNIDFSVYRSERCFFVFYLYKILIILIFINPFFAHKQKKHRE